MKILNTEFAILKKGKRSVEINLNDLIDLKDKTKAIQRSEKGSRMLVVNEAGDDTLYVDTARGASDNRIVLWPEGVKPIHSGSLLEK